MKLSQLKKLILLIGIVTSSSNLVSQYYYKQYDRFENQAELGRVIAIGDQSIFVLAGSICYDSSNNPMECLMIYSFDYTGELVWTKKYESYDRGNHNSMILDKDTILISFHGQWTENKSDFGIIKLDKQGKEVFVKKFNYDNIFENQLANNGITKNDNKVVLYGSGLLKSNLVSGFISSYNSAGIQMDYDTLVVNGRGWNNIPYLEYNVDGKIFYMVSSSNQGRDHKREIYKEGEILNANEPIWSSSEGVHNNKIKDIMTILPNGNIVILDNYNEPEYNYPISLLCIDTTGTEVWRREWERELWLNKGNLYNISFISSNATNGVIGCGEVEVFSDDKQEYVKKGYAFEIDNSGNLIWEHTYSLQESIIEFNAIKYLGDGSIVVTGGIKDSIIQDYNLLLMKLNEFGCFNDLNCDEQVSLLTTTDDNLVINDYSADLLMYPNPTTDFIKIETPKQEGVIIIFSLEGIELFKSNKEINIEQVNFNIGNIEYRGMAIVKFIDMKYTIRDLGILIIE